MTVADLVVQDASVMTPTGRVSADIAIHDGKILAITAGESVPSHIDSIDARGKVVIPGLIDTHAHLREPGHTHKEDIEHGTRAAAAGGYTTVVGMPNVSPPTNTVERYAEVIQIYGRSSIVDFNHNPSGAVIEEITGLAAAGALAFKVYMVEDSGRDYLRLPGISVTDHGHIYDIAEAVAPTKRPLMVHPHNQGLMRAIEARFHARGERDHLAYARAFASHDGIVWDTAVAVLVRLQEATGVHMHVLHIKTRRMIELIRAAKARGQRVTSELNPVSLLLANEWENIERLGPYALSTWIGEGETDALWDALRDGTIDLIGTDHAPHTREEKELGWTDMWKAAGGLPHLQETLPLFLTEVDRGHLTMERLVEITSSIPARTFNIYPRKGAIQVGSDADLVVIDTEVTREIREDEVLSKCGWSAFRGRQVRGAVVMTLLRGRVIYRNGVITGDPGYGSQVRPEPALA